MMKNKFTLLSAILSVAGTLSASDVTTTPAPDLVVTNDLSVLSIEIADRDRVAGTVQVAIDRFGAESGMISNVTNFPAKAEERQANSINVVLGGTEIDALKKEWAAHPDARPDAYLIRTVSTSPLVIYASGNNARGTLYAAYALSALIKERADLSALRIYREPLVAQRYASAGATTHGRKYYRPDLYNRTLNELPRYGINGILVYPGGGTPIGRKASPVLEKPDGSFHQTADNKRRWNESFDQIRRYGMEIMMTIPPVRPSGYKPTDLTAYYQGGPEPKDYLVKLKAHFRNYLEIMARDYRKFDGYMFNSTEGATFGRNKRFFDHPNPKKYPIDDYLKNNATVMRAYLDVLKEFFGKEFNKVCFWTHSYGLYTSGLRKMREVLFEYPELTILEDDYWNNNMWPMDVPSMYYLPEDLRAEVSKRNPYGLFQIVPDGEYFGGGSLPTAYPDSHIRSSKDAVARSARLVIQRFNLHDWTTEGTAFGIMDIVPTAASRCLWSDAPDAPQLWSDWAKMRFGQKAAPFVVKALQESKTYLFNSIACNGVDMMCGSKFQPNYWVPGNPYSRVQLFSKPGVLMLKKKEGADIQSSEYTMYQMKTRTIAITEYRQRLQTAHAAVDRGLAALGQARPYLTADQYAMLTGKFLRGRNILRALSCLSEGAYALNILQDNFDKVKDPAANYARAMKQFRDYLATDTGLPALLTANLNTIYKNYEKAGERQ
jgi:hypothetical protein